MCSNFLELLAAHSVGPSVGAGDARGELDLFAAVTEAFLVSLVAVAVLALGLTAARSLLFVGGAQSSCLRGVSVAMGAKVWDQGSKDMVESSSKWENPTVGDEGHSHPLGTYYPPIKPEKPKKGYWYNSKWEKVEVDGPNDPQQAGLPAWDLELKFVGINEQAQEPQATPKFD